MAEPAPDPWLSIITVVKDDADGFARTMASVREQDTTGVEFLVIDSSSEPSPIPALASTDATVVWVPPRGIYPAMNEGLHRARGRLAFFLNAGDVLDAPDVLTRVRPLLAGATWGFGDVAIIGTDGRRIVPPPMDYDAEERALFARGRFPGHQGTFAARQALLDAGGFDEQYAIAADYAMFLSLSTMARPVVLPLTIAAFFEGGASTTHWRSSFREFHRARRAILRPHGRSALRERVETVRHFAAVWTYRSIVAPLRGRG